MARQLREWKTNALRALDRASITYETRYFNEDEDALNSHSFGLDIAELLGEDPDMVFKTLVTRGASGVYVVCCIPVTCELDLKRASVAAQQKSLTMLALRDLERVTGYVRGGCSPIGMKQAFPTIIDETALLYDAIGISGGCRGLQILVDPNELAQFCGASFADITRR